MPAIDVTKVATPIVTTPEEPAPRWDVPMKMVFQVMDKLYTGEYATEEVPCPCGIQPADDTEITTKDRYGIAHRMVMCEHCLLMRATPRMTPEAYRQFYNNEYRLIYDGFPYGERMLDTEWMFQRGLKSAQIIHDLITEFDIHPKSVLEIGCDKGANLWPWMEAGATAYGIEVCDQGRVFCDTKGIKTFASLDDALAAGIKADLLIASDLIEHLTDLWEVRRWKDLLTPEGRVFVYTPGLLASPPSQVFQNAHTYQFIGMTLDYYMRTMGYVPEAQDDRCIFIGRYFAGDPQRVINLPDPPKAWRKYVIEHLEQTPKRTVPPVWTTCKFTEKQMFANLEANLALKVPSIATIQHTCTGPAMVLAGGPSLDGQVEKIRELQAQGVKTFVIERLYPWATQAGLKADYVVSLDASEGVEEGFTHLQPETTHLVIASGNPVVLPMLKDHTRYIFSGVAGLAPGAAELWAKYGYRQLTVVNTGGSVALASMYLALILGYRNLHIFGFDCMVPDPKHDYSTHVVGESVPRGYFEAEVGSEKVLTCAAFLAFAQQFFEMMDTARRWGMLESIDVYGESLVNKMFESDERNQLTVHA